MRRVPFLIPAAIGLILSSAAADEVRTADGRVLVGPTKKVGKSLHVQTTEGVVVVPLADVARVRTDAELRTEWQGLRNRAGATPHGRLQLARTARDYGLYDEMWDTVEPLVERRAPESASDQRLRQFLAELEPVVLPVKYREKPTQTRVQELLYRIRPGTRPGIEAAVVELLAQEAEADPFLKARARSAGRPAQRLAAVAALARRPAEGNDRFVYRTTIVDRAQKVRAGAAAILREREQTTSAVQYLAPGLLHDSPTVRIRTAEAYGFMADGSAIDVLVKAAPFAGKPMAAGADGGSVRGHVAFINQQSYLQDFDVEVAQASFIADPKVNVLQSGVVLDTTVHAVVAHRTEIVGAYRNALRRIARSDPGSNTGKWVAWRDELTGQKKATGEPGAPR